ncbi:hydantoinase B/oxoprolinase family protein [Cohnella nanjingensis]|uniref:Hydantoinase B/oxoprolinase family protein n=1 Tax=Cohnella nanjingensis TaxID=1387779 RepID=A0A7X0S0Z4_9BACL|nr:hydantoinase B/oxoprolinase family protein [Cohnella nanjingensis]MBB6675664.1 hydantoinase B/oxoprolinase family protein [Cohnella nanjingensis]
MRTNPSDRILSQVVGGTLDSVAQEMSAVVTRTARSPLFNEAHDFTTGIFDLPGSQSRLVAQAPGCTLHLYAVVSAVDRLMEAFRYDLHPGDVLLVNDPYYGGSHSLDWTIVTPVFHGRKPMLLPAVRSHMGDNGGPVAGGYNPRSRDIWQDGLRIPPIKLYERGEKRRDVFEMILGNNRLAHWLEGDLDAMIGACKVAAERIQSLLERYGGDAVAEAVDSRIAYTEKRVREEIASWPDGTYTAETFADHDFQGMQDIQVRATVTVSGSDLAIDFTGSSPQVAGFVNSPLSNTTSFAFVAISTCCDEDIPINEGYMNPVTVTAPLGTVVNPKPPAPCGHATACVGAEIAEAVLLALSQCAPNRVGVNAHKLPLAYSHGQYEDGRPWVNLNFYGYTGGAGAAYGTDGWGLYPPVMTGVILPSIEMTELQYPSRVLQHEYKADFTGPGRWRGAPGLEVRIQHLADSRTSVMMAGVRHTTQGFCGAGAGPSNRVVVDEGRPGALEVPETAFNVGMAAGGVLAFHRSGGGGWGDPLDREAEAVLDDVLNGYVSVEHAFADYGVVIQSIGKKPVLDLPATIAERDRRRSS